MPLDHLRRNSHGGDVIRDIIDTQRHGGDDHLLPPLCQEALLYYGSVDLCEDLCQSGLLYSLMLLNSPKRMPMPTMKVVNAEDPLLLLDERKANPLGPRAMKDLDEDLWREYNSQL